MLLQANQVVRHLPGETDGEKVPIFLGVPLNRPPVVRQILPPAARTRQIKIPGILRTIAEPRVVRGEERLLDLAVDLYLAEERGLEIGKRDRGGSGGVGGSGGGGGGSAVEEAEEAGALGAEEVEGVQLGLAHAGGGRVGSRRGGGEPDGGGERRSPAEGEEEDDEEDWEGDADEEVAAGPEAAAEGRELGVEAGHDAEGGTGAGGGGGWLGVVLGHEGLEVVVLVGDGRFAVHGGGPGGKCRCGAGVATPEGVE